MRQCRLVWTRRTLPRRLDWSNGRVYPQELIMKLIIMEYMAMLVVGEGLNTQRFMGGEVNGYQSIWWSFAKVKNASDRIHMVQEDEAQDALVTMVYMVKALLLHQGEVVMVFLVMPKVKIMLITDYMDTRWCNYKLGCLCYWKFILHWNFIKRCR